MRDLLMVIAIVAPAWFGVPSEISAQSPLREADMKSEVQVDAVASSRADYYSATAAAYERHEYSLEADGSLSGEVRMFDAGGATTGARTQLAFVRRGQVVARAMAGDDGAFRASGLTPGYYSVIAAGQGGFAASAVRVLSPPKRPEPPKADTIGLTRDVSQASSVSVPLVVSTIQPIDVRVAFYLAQRFVPGAYPVSTPFRAAASNRGSTAAGVRPAALMRSTSPSGQAAPASTSAAFVAEGTEAIAMSADRLENYRNYRFALSPDGALRGRLRMIDENGGLIPADVRLFFVRDGYVIRQAAVDPAGNFTTGAIQPGYYSIVAVGPSGLAAAGATITSAPVTGEPASPGTVRTISVRQEDSPPVNLAPIPVQDVAQTQQIAQEQNSGGVGDQPPPSGAPPTPRQ